MKKIPFLFVAILTSLFTLAGEKQPDVSEFSISNRAGSINGFLDGPGTFNRALTMITPDLTCFGLGSDLSGVGTNVFYEVHALYSPTGENLVAELNAAFDTYLLLYCDPFNPALPLANLRFADDDGGIDLNSAFLPGDNVYLEANTPYFLVVSSFSNGITGDYTLSVDGNVVLLDDRCSGTVGLVGEFNKWGTQGDPDFDLTQDPGNPDLWTGTIVLNAVSDMYGDPAVIEMKFRLNSDWAINWGATDFPAGIGYQDGPNIPVPIDPNVPKEEYFVTFNCATGEYTFENLRVIPVAGWAIYLGIFLMVAFTFLRFRKIF